MFEYFYNEIFRSVIIGFGSLFNGIEIKHKDGDGDTFSVIQVPLAYGPTQKFLARMKQEADLNKPIQMTLPRMSFEFLGLTYDPSRKSTQTTTIINQTPDGENIKRNYMPVPYNMSIQLSIMTKLNDDMLQIIEQILPYFQPAYNLPINFLGNLKEKRDIPIQLDSISMDDDYEGNFDTRRALIYTLNFTAKVYLFGPISDVTGDIIKKVSVGYIAGSRGSQASARDLTYQVTPRATRDYNGSTVTTLAQNVNLVETVLDVADGSKVTAQTYIYVGQEEMYVESVTGNKITVRRAQDNTTPQNHVLGAAVNSITAADDALIEFGDDFGFNGSVF
jgi:hypothetical protein